jgi:hypothetical protein
MNTQRLRSKRVVIPTAAAAVLLGGGGMVWANAASADVSPDDLDRAKRAALDAVGSGTVTETEVDDEDAYYEIEITKADGTQVDVAVDENFRVVGQETDGEDDED